jgi:hypothetical protein
VVELTPQAELGERVTLQSEATSKMVCECGGPPSPIRLPPHFAGSSAFARDRAGASGPGPIAGPAIRGAPRRRRAGDLARPGEHWAARQRCARVKGRLPGVSTRGELHV